MPRPIGILLQTTIRATTDDWHIGRLSVLRDFLASQSDDNGSPLFEVGKGCPSLVDEPSGIEIERYPERLNDIKTYVRNLALWLKPATRQEEALRGVPNAKRS